MKSTQQVLQYLERYVDVESRDAARFVSRYGELQYKQVLCVPVFDEEESSLNRLTNHPNVDGTLIIAVVNAPESADPAARKRTLELLDRMRERATYTTERGHALLTSISGKSPRCSVLAMDYCSSGHTLPSSEGVGLARKLGNDVALELWHEGRIESPWLFQTDGDATLPDNYFNTPIDADSAVALHLDFEHVRNGGISLAQSLYDLKLDYYVAGLTHAHSPYGHYSLGSAMVIHAQAYASVRGYPKRSAGEDFYLLDKLAKVGTIRFDKTRTVTLQERLSTRVPFGTGPGVARFQNLKNPLEAKEYYAPACFDMLKIWLALMDEFATHQSGNPQFNVRHCFDKSVQKNTARSILTSALEKLELFQWCEETIRNNARPAQAKHQIKLGMDALKTLKLVHVLRDLGLANVNAVEAQGWINALPAELIRSSTRLGRNSNRHITLRGT